jgi:hypothetical protein
MDMYKKPKEVGAAIIKAQPIHHTMSTKSGEKKKLGPYTIEGLCPSGSKGKLLKIEGN